MLKNLRKFVLVPIASFASAVLMPASANADGGDYLLPVVASIGEFNVEQDDGVNAPNASCGPSPSAPASAWLLRRISQLA